MYLIIENINLTTCEEDIAQFLSSKGFTDYDHIDIRGTATKMALVHCLLPHTALEAVANYLNHAYWQGQFLAISSTHIFP